MSTIFWDIETAPLPEAEILSMAPEFTAPANYRDPEKIEANIAEQRAAWIQRAALSPLTGSVCAIGMLGGDITLRFSDISGERAIIGEFWHTVYENPSRFIGFCVKTFDLPFLVRRSWKLGITVPSIVRDGRYWSSMFIDLAEVWQLGNYQDRVSLDALSKFLGLAGKNGKGENFHKLPLEQQREYLTRDLELVRDCAAKMLPKTKDVIP